MNIAIIIISATIINIVHLPLVLIPRVCSIVIVVIVTRIDSVIRVIVIVIRISTYIITSVIVVGDLFLLIIVIIEYFTEILLELFLWDLAIE